MFLSFPLARSGGALAATTLWPQAGEFLSRMSFSRSSFSGIVAPQLLPEYLSPDRGTAAPSRMCFSRIMAWSELLSALCSLLSALLSALCSLLSAPCSLLSALCSPLSALCSASSASPLLLCFSCFPCCLSSPQKHRNIET